VAVVALWLTKAAADPLAAALQQNTTAPSAAASPHYSASVGYICAAVSIFGFGSNFVPVKRFETGDGMFFQWVLCAAIWCVGLLVYGVQGFPTFQPGAMLGGAIWATGNIMCVPIIKILGLSLGLLIWGQTNMLIGWATGYFGLFGVASQAHLTKNHTLNFLGVGLAVVALSLYIFVEPPKDDEAEVAGSGDASVRGGAAGNLDETSAYLIGDPIGRASSGGRNSELGQSLLSNSKPYSSLPPRNRANERLLQHARQNDFAGISATPRLLGNQTYAPVVSAQSSSVPSNNLSAVDQGMEAAEIGEGRGTLQVDVVVSSSNPIDSLSNSSKRLLGVAMSVISGLFYGSNFTPPQIVHDHGVPCGGDGSHGLPGCGDQDMLDYVFPHFTGIFLTSTFYFLLYCAFMKNRPHIYPQAILPAFASGIMWAAAQSCWFIANEALGFATSFPIITSGPGFVASMWGVCLFNEIKGARNFGVLGLALIITVSSGVCISLSRG
jgi:glucose uptake protein GlcU